MTQSPPTYDDWMDAVEAQLKGKPFDRLRTVTEDGFELDPLYTDADPMPVPGVRTDRAWDVRTTVQHPDLTIANIELLRDLERGATSVSLQLDRQRRDHGRAAIDIDSAPAVLDGGPPVGWLDDLDQLLEDVYLELAEIAYDAGWAAIPVGLAHLALADVRDVPRSDLLGSLGVDPFAAWNRAAGGPMPLRQAVDQAAGWFAPALAASWPRVRPLAIDTVVYSSAGATDAEELALLLATGVEWARAAERADVDLMVVLGGIEARVAVGADVFGGVAKMRAARRLWDALLGALGVPELVRDLRLHAVTAPRMFTRIDPWVNLLRGTAACFAAAVGGADGATVLSFEHRHGLPAELGRRMSRNTHTVLAEESHLGAVTDPSAGSWYLDARSAKLAEAAWAEFQRIEGDGGVLAMIEAGQLAARFVDQAVRRADRVADRSMPLTGVTEFPLLDGLTPATVRPDIEALRAARGAAVMGRSGPIDLTADLESTLAALRAGAALPVAGDGAHAGAGLPVRHLSDDIDQLRSAADEHESSTGRRPTVFLANLGPLAEHTARTTFVVNLLAVGGIDGVGPDGEVTLDELMAAFTEAATPVVCLCSSDDRYASEARLVAAALRSAGAEHVLLAGRADVEGVDDHLALGIDVVDALTRLHVALGVSP